MSATMAAEMRRKVGRVERARDRRAGEHLRDTDEKLAKIRAQHDSLARDLGLDPVMFDARFAALTQVIAGINGFKAYYLVRTAAGEALSVSVYDDKTGGEASNRAAAGWIGENLPDMSVSAPQVTEGEAVIAF